MDSIAQDVRAALRSLRARPGFVVVAVLTLALGIGANAAIFSVVHAVLLRQLPYQDPDRLMVVQVERTDGDLEPLAILDFEDYRAAGALAALAAYTEGGVNLTGDVDPERLQWTRVSDGFFELLGVAPALGRGFRPDESVDGGARVVVITDGLWRRRFAADPRIVGRAVVLGDESHTVVGVMPAGFLFPGARAELAAPIDLGREPRRPRRDANFLRVLGRLAPDVPRARVQAQLDAVAARLRQDHPEANARKRAIVLQPIADQLVGRFRGMLALLLGAVGLVLVVACANLASLILAVALRRRRELALRAALGASATRLVRQLLIESSTLAVLGGALGLLVAGWGVDLLVALSPAQIPRLRDAGVDGPVLAFTAALSAATVLLFGLVPALGAARTAPLAGLLDGRIGPGPGQTRARRALVAAEVALSLGLLALAGLLVRSFVRLERTRPGFEPAHALTVRLALPPQRYADRAALVRFQDDLRARLRAVPGTIEAASIHALPLSGVLSTTDFTVEGRPPPRAGDVPQLHYRMVSPRSLAALGIPLVEGRDITETDGAQAPPVVVINRRLAQRFFPDGGAVGARLFLDDLGPKPRPATIIGVAGDVRELGLDNEPVVTAYVPLAQAPETAAAYGRNMFWVVRTAGEPLASARTVIDAVHSVDAALPVAQVQSLEQIVAGSMAPRRFNLVLVNGFAAAALLLAAIGIYALTAQLVAGRTRELGIRLALGARPERLLVLALSDGLRPVLVGAALGIIAALVVGRLAAALLFQIDASDPASLIGATAVLLVTALFAAWLPARRVMRTDPLIVLRAD